jgi:hypothetical protein
MKRFFNRIYVGLYSFIAAVEMHDRAWAWFGIFLALALLFAAAATDE